MIPSVVIFFAYRIYYFVLTSALPWGVEFMPIGGYQEDKGPCYIWSSSAYD